MAGSFGKRLRGLRGEYQILQSAFADKCGISAAYLSDIERGKRNPPPDETILEWARILDRGQAEEIGQELIELSARDQGRAQAVTEVVEEPAGTIWEKFSDGLQGDGNKTEEGKKSRTPFLDHFGVNLVEKARKGAFDSASERGWEFGEIAHVMARRHLNSAVVTGENSADIFRTIRGLACEMAAGRMSGPLAARRLLKLEGMQAGVKYRGQLEERIKTIISETADCRDAVLFLHSLSDVVELEKNANGSYFLPALQEGAIQIITGATWREMDGCRRQNASLVECFRPVSVRPLERDAVLRGINVAKESYEDFHGVKYSEGALVAIVDAAEEGEEAGFWQRALDLLDEAGERGLLSGKVGELTEEDVDRAVSQLPKKKVS
jgi:ATP-dependent Clp protease ATP-binding subunit ClpA